ncbi:AMMECR1 domain-containing protein [Anaerococcus sp. AGMB00486]|uniref:AMMECR1 domain-containing protein n=1 Tax=Anaerococcus faecalis TaxID=2742993 RepID=A0ABX2NA62_9FIRM|nr:AMMECR1 domain-containing protein [Anaerococcus faecalis]NVF11576.1 AMMECR1 domain-containing protein [Anaerococcus faecalis]
MDDYVKLSLNAIKNYLENKTYLREFNDYFKNMSNGIVVKIENGGRLKGISGSIFPSKENMGLDIVYESINAGFFDLSFNPITKNNIKNLDITIYEFYDVERLPFIEDFDDYDGVMINFMDKNHYVFRKDFDSDLDMLKEAIKKANVDSWDNFSIDKFKVNIHK